MQNRSDGDGIVLATAFMQNCSDGDGIVLTTVMMKNRCDGDSAQGSVSHSLDAELF